MFGGAGKGLLAVERETLLSGALGLLLPHDIEVLERIGHDVRNTVNILLESMLVRDGQASHPSHTALNAIAERLSRHGVSSSSACRIFQTLAQAAFQHFDCGTLGFASAGIGLGALRSQTLLLEAFMEAETKRREEITQRLREVDRFPDTIASTLNPQTLTKMGLLRLKGLVEMEEATVMEVVDGRRLLPLEGDLAGDDGDSTAVELSSDAAYALCERKEPYWEVSAAEEASIAGTWSRERRTTVLMLPMVVRGRTTGVICLSGRGREPLSPGEIELGERFASRFAVALESAHMHAREQRKIKETVALLEITRAINSSLDLGEVLDKAARMTVDLCGVAACAVYLREDGVQQLLPAAHYGFIESIRRDVEGGGVFDAEKLERKHLEVLERGEPALLGPEEAAVLLSPELLCEHGIDTALLFPMNSRDRLTGLFCLFYPCRKREELEREEIEVVSAIASQAALAIENAALYEDIERGYYSTVKALAKAIEVKDPYTHGHSERVTGYALMIADAMHLDERERQKLKYAATLHDIGKIGIAGRVLNKPGELTDEEYTHVKTHPLLGESIVEPVEFLRGPRPIILHHHERFDGTGYPAGLKGAGIPLCARILSVADAFEAMRSDRPYRRALALDTAVRELKRNAGSQFDPQVVDVFLEIIEGHGGDPIER